MLMMTMTIMYDDDDDDDNNNLALDSLLCSRHFSRVRSPVLTWHML